MATFQVCLSVIVEVEARSQMVAEDKVAELRDAISAMGPERFHLNSLSCELSGVSLEEDEDDDDDDSDDDDFDDEFDDEDHGEAIDRASISMGRTVKYL